MIALGLLKIKAPSEMIIAKFKIPNSSHTDAPGYNRVLGRQNCSMNPGLVSTKVKQIQLNEIRPELKTYEHV